MDFLSRFSRIAPGLSALVAIVAFTGCAEAPVSLKYEVKAALETAREKQADVYAPEILARSEGSYREGVLAIDAESARWSLARDYGVALAHLQTALSRARLAGSLADDRRRDLAERTETLLSSAHGSIGNLEFIFSYLSPNTRARCDLMHARVLYEEAGALRKHGDLTPALDRAGRAARETALLSETVARIIDRFAGSERLADYRRWIRDTVNESVSGASTAILVDKLRHTLTLLRQGRILRTYHAELGLNGSSDKAVAGDKATPEGRYRIVEKKNLGETHWHRALLINYPNESDRTQFAEAQRRGEISRRARIGGLIEIHGEGGRQQDWTEGCIALDNEDIDDLFRLVDVGTPITIVGYEGDNWLDLPESRAPKSRQALADRSPLRRGVRSRSRR